MSTQQVQQQASLTDIVKQVFSVIFLVSGIGAFYYFSDVQLIYRVILLLVIVIIVLVTLYATALGKSIFGFFLESKQEVRRVVWPTREETMKTTGLVFVMVFAVGLVLWLLDMFLFWGVRFLTGQGA